MRRGRRTDPLMPDQVRGFLETASAVAADRFTTLPRQTAEVRTTVCSLCPDFAPALRRCGRCGCFVDIKAMFPKKEGFGRTVRLYTQEEAEAIARAALETARRKALWLADDGDHTVANAIRALMNDAAALAEIVKGVKG